MNSPTAALLAAAAALLAAARGAAQEEAALLAAFDAAASEYSAARGETRQALAAAASSAFLRLPDGEGRARRLALGAEATLDAGRVELALRLSVAPVMVSPGSGNRATVADRSRFTEPMTTISAISAPEPRESVGQQVVEPVGVDRVDPVDVVRPVRDLPEIDRGMAHRQF